MKPFKFSPIFKTVVWGGNKIAQHKGISTTQQNIGESWELSGVKGDESIVAEGHYSGWSLPELINHFKGELVGEAVYRKHGDEFPLLIKLIDARDDLSIQVHPNDKLSHLRHGKKGKTEMWYVIDAEKDASLKSGLNKSVTPEEYIQLIDSDKITEVLQEHRVQKDDVFFLPAGRIHAIGAGTLIAEIQQTSDVTYRIYDYGRLGLDGRPRELHTDLAKEAINYTVYEDYRTTYTPVLNEKVNLVSCEYFKTDLLELDMDCHLDLKDINSFIVVMCLRGEADFIDNPGETNNISNIKQGETILIPAVSEEYRICPIEKVKLLISYIP